MIDIESSRRQDSFSDISLIYQRVLQVLPHLLRGDLMAKSEMIAPKVFSVKAVGEGIDVHEGVKTTHLTAYSLLKARPMTILLISLVPAPIS